MNEGAPSAAETKGDASGMVRAGHLARVARAALWLALLGVAAWDVLFLAYAPMPGWLGRTLAFFLVAGLLAICGFVRPHGRKVTVTIGLLVLPVLYWVALRPSNDRDWQPDVALLPYADIDGDRVTVHNIRNCEYRSATDFDVRYYDRTFDLDKLQSLDLFLADWGLRKVAHTMLSFGFADDRYVCVSIETRKEAGESYSAAKGFFRHYEIIYVIGDERDLVRLRTNYRKGEDVRLYRLKPASDKVMRDVFLDFMAHINQLKDHPQWYNALTSNCMTSAFCHFRRKNDRFYNKT